MSSASIAEQPQSRRGFLREIEAVGAAIAGVGAPFDKPGRSQFIDQPANGDRREIEKIGKLALLDPFAALQAHQKRPLRAGHIEFARTLIGIDPHETRDVMERER